MTSEQDTERRLSWGPIAGALVIAAVVGLIVFLVGSKTDNSKGTRTNSDGSLICPSSYLRSGTDVVWVPGKPSGFDGTKSLVPNVTPTHISVCVYSSSRADGPITLSHHTTLTSGLDIATTYLSGLPKTSSELAVPNTSGGKQTFYLLGITFAAGDVWVAAPGASGASNGTFATATPIASKVQATIKDRAWG